MWLLVATAYRNANIRDRGVYGRIGWTIELSDGLRWFPANSVMTQALRKAGIAKSVHGFRSSFKDWARHEGVDEILSEFALAHVEGSKTVAAYARDDLLEKRRPVMQAWCDYLTAAPGG